MIESLTRIEAAARRMDGYADEWVPRYLAEELARERDNALSDAHQSEVDSLRALHERNEAREQLNEALNDLEFRRGLYRVQTELLDNTIAERDSLRECVYRCHDAIGESRGSDHTELFKYFDGHAALIARVRQAEEQRDRLADVLALVGGAIPADRSTTKTCYAINDDIRDAVHKALAVMGESRTPNPEP